MEWFMKALRQYAVFTGRARRMHDIGPSGWWVLVSFIPFIGWLIFLWLAARDGDAGPNAYGPDPKANSPTA
jgi:uncharacterized membrane protein YhaH (DUF805 family)